MAKGTVLCFLFAFIIYSCVSSFVFHENTNILFTPGKTNLFKNSYFGYSTVLTTDRLIIGAPRAALIKNRRKLNSAGQVFICALKNLDMGKRDVSCDLSNTTKLDGKDPYLRISPRDTQSGMWLGASMVALKDQTLWVAAPRYTSSGRGLEGVCYYANTRRTFTKKLLSVMKYEKYKLDGVRASYGKVNDTIGYYSMGELGFSMALSKMNSVIVGAPGLLALAGGVISPSSDVNAKITINNPYYTEDVSRDEYLGYSVESGIFENNGTMMFVGGAPRFDLGRGKVLIFKPPVSENHALNISVKLLGPQVGSYFGASLCCTDINGDGLDDLLVGAPTFVTNDGALPYDQGAVFIYLAQETKPGFVLVESGHVVGSGVDGAWFGTAIADLGDVDGDNYTDIVIGAPYEDNGVGAVYIYKGNAMGLKQDYSQRIQPAGARGFGWSISKGVDIDKNKCNDVAIGAYNSDTTYLYRCIPTMSMNTTIIAPSRISLQQTETTFNVTLCVSAPSIKFGSRFQLDLTGRIIVDSNKGRAIVAGESEFNVTLNPGGKTCIVTDINVNLTSDLIRPINLTFELEAHELLNENSTRFLKNAVRLSEDSIKKTTKLVQVLIGCGDDLICNPWLNITAVPLESPYIPGLSKRFGVRLEVINEGEPAYGASINITLPMQPIRIPDKCFFNNTIMTCDIPQPFFQNESISFEIEMEFDYDAIRNDSVVTMELYDRYDTNDNMTDEKIKNITIEIQPESGFIVTGQSMPNTSVLIFRDDWETGANISFQHTFQITNVGPSDCHTLIAHIQIPDKTSLGTPITECEDMKSIYKCTWSVPVKTTIQVSMKLQMDLRLEGKYFEENITFDAMSSVFILEPKYVSYVVTTTLILEPASIPIWFIIGPCIAIGLILLGFLTWALYRFGFFSRPKQTYNKLATTEIAQPQQEPGPSNPTPSAPEEDELEQLAKHGIKLEELR